MNLKRVRKDVYWHFFAAEDNATFQELMRKIFIYFGGETLLKHLQERNFIMLTAQHQLSNRGGRLYKASTSEQGTCLSHVGVLAKLYHQDSSAKY